MKKIFFTGMLMLVTGLAIHAQSLTGKQWCTVLNDEDGQGIAVALTFEKNGSCEMLIAAQQEMKEDGVPITLVAGVTVPGSYKRDGNDLNNQFNNGKAKVDVDYEIKGMDAKTKALLGGNAQDGQSEDRLARQQEAHRQERRQSGNPVLCRITDRSNHLYDRHHQNPLLRAVPLCSFLRYCLSGSIRRGIHRQCFRGS